MLALSLLVSVLVFSQPDERMRQYFALCSLVVLRQVENGAENRCSGTWKDSHTLALIVHDEALGVID